MRLQTYINEGRKKQSFVRFGGLSKVNQKKYGLVDSGGFHAAPVKKGIYAFIWPYIEPFLFAWKHKFDIPPNEVTNKWTDKQWIEYGKEEQKSFKKFYKDNKKKFQYEGLLWTHFTDLPPKYIRRRKGTWVEVHTSDWDEILKKQKHLDMKYDMKMDMEHFGVKKLSVGKDPYKRGLGGSMSKDHLEVFIEKVN